ncbi:MAG: hypothetical protein PVJ86_01045, partial [Phycisphaerales bacterium]
MRLSDFKCCQCKGGESGSQKPKTHYDLRLAPAGQVKMVMDGGTSEKPFSAGVSKIADLQHYTEKFDDKYATYYQKQNFIPGYQSPVTH